MKMLQFQHPLLVYPACQVSIKNYYFCSFSCTNITTFTFRSHVLRQNNAVLNKKGKLLRVCERRVGLLNRFSQQGSWRGCEVGSGHGYTMMSVEH
jgi:hypothetical protein